MSGINKVILIGRLGQEVDLRTMPNGNTVANFTVATSEEWKDQKTGEKKQKVEWHRIVMYKRLAEIAGEYLKKGSKVYLEGRLQTRKWQNQQGVDQYTTEVIVHEMQMLDSRQNNQQSIAPQASSQAPQQANTVAQQSPWPQAPQQNTPPAKPAHMLNPQQPDDEIPF